MTFCHSFTVQRPYSVKLSFLKNWGGSTVDVMEMNGRTEANQGGAQVFFFVEVNVTKLRTLLGK